MACLIILYLYYRDIRWSNGFRVGNESKDDAYMDSITRSNESEEEEDKSFSSEIIADSGHSVLRNGSVGTDDQLFGK